MNRLIKYGLICIFMLIRLSVYSQNNRHQLLFLDSVSNTPIQFVLLQSVDKKVIYNGDENGVCYLNFKKTSDFYTHCIGYESRLIHVKPTETNNQIVYLSPKISSLAEVTILSKSNLGVLKSISELDIHIRPITNSQEVLRMVPGLFIGQHAGGGKAEQIFLRGFDLDHGTDINITVDGMPVNMVSHAHGQGYADLHFVIPELIENVNFNKGPYYASKGNLTTAGFVEFNTKEYLKRNFVKIEAGQFDTYRIVTGINLIKNRNKSLIFATEASFTNGYFENPQRFSRNNFLLKYHHKINDINTISSSISFFTSQWNASGQIPLRAYKNGTIGFFGAIDNNEGGKTSRTNANFELRTKVGSNSFLKNQIYLTNYNFNLYSNFTFFKFDSLNGDQIRQKESRYLIGTNSEFQYNYLLLNRNSDFKIGLQSRFDLINNIELSRTLNRDSVTMNLMLGDVNESNLSLYFSQSVNITNKLNLTTSFRVENLNNSYADKKYNTTASVQSYIILPKLNFEYNLNEKVQLYLYNGKGYHSVDSRVSVLNNSTIKLPAAYGSDIGGVFKIHNNVILQTAIWYLYLQKEYIYVGDEGVLELGGRSLRTGSDLSLRVELKKNIYADFDITLSKSRLLDLPNSENYIPLSPNFVSVGGFSYRQAKGLNGSLRYRFMNNRPANEDNTIVAKGYFVLDLNVNYSLSKWEFGLSVQNLLNSKWYETQFDTESKLKSESVPVSEIHFTPGSPFYLRVNVVRLF
jgi:hypothetical protein